MFVFVLLFKGNFIALLIFLSVSNASEMTICKVTAQNALLHSHFSIIYCNQFQCQFSFCTTDMHLKMSRIPQFNRVPFRNVKWVNNNSCGCINIISPTKLAFLHIIWWVTLTKFSPLSSLQNIPKAQKAYAMKLCCLPVSCKPATRSYIFHDFLVFLLARFFFPCTHTYASAQDCLASQNVSWPFY